MSACTFSLDSSGTWTTLATPPSSIDGSHAVPLPGRRGSVCRRRRSGIRAFVPSGQPSSTLPRIVGVRAPRFPLPTGFAVAALANGSVLIAGGSSETGDVGVLAASWLYDPKANSWRRVGDLKMPVSDATAVQLTDGRVLIAGGTVPLAQPVHLPDGSTSYFGFTNALRYSIRRPLPGQWSAPCTSRVGTRLSSACLAGKRLSPAAARSRPSDSIPVARWPAQRCSIPPRAPGPLPARCLRRDAALMASFCTTAAFCCSAVRRRTSSRPTSTTRFSTTPRPAGGATRDRWSLGRLSPQCWRMAECSSPRSRWASPTGTSCRSSSAVRYSIPHRETGASSPAPRPSRRFGRESRALFRWRSAPTAATRSS